MLKFKVAINGDKKSSEMYRQDCEMAMNDLDLDVVSVVALEDEIDTLDDDGYNDELEDEDGFLRDWRYFYLVTINSELSPKELEDWLNENLNVYDLESDVETV